MENWNEIKHGDKVQCKNDNSVLEVIVYNGDKYLAGERDMWNVKEFDPKEWKVIREEK